jgi:hypothetical protein
VLSDGHLKWTGRDASMLLGELRSELGDDNL